MITAQKLTAIDRRNILEMRSDKKTPSEEWPALRSNHTRVVPPSPAVPKSGSLICLSGANISVTMSAIRWGVGGTNTQMHAQTLQTSTLVPLVHDEIAQPHHAHETVAVELDAARESVLELRAYGAALELESDSIIWPDVKIERDLAYTTEMHEWERLQQRIDLGFDLQMRCLEDAASCALKRFGMLLVHGHIDAIKVLLRQPLFVRLVTANVSCTRLWKRQMRARPEA